MLHLWPMPVFFTVLISSQRGSSLVPYAVSAAALCSPPVLNLKSPCPCQNYATQSGAAMQQSCSCNSCTLLSAEHLRSAPSASLYAKHSPHAALQRCRVLPHPALLLLLLRSSASPSLRVQPVQLPPACPGLPTWQWRQSPAQAQHSSRGQQQQRLVSMMETEAHQPCMTL